MTDFFGNLIDLFDERVNQLLSTPSARPTHLFMKTQKYTYLGLTDQALVSLLKGLFGNQPSTYLPQPTSSLVLEFYQLLSSTPPTYDRSNYFVKILLDDVNLAPNLTLANVTCTALTCNWDSLVTRLQQRMYSE